MRHPMIPADRYISARAQNAKQENLRQPARFKAIWISDVHLGDPQCKAERLLELLQLTESESLYLVGDFFDRRAPKRQRYRDQSQREIVQAISDKASHGTQVFFIPCSHDPSFGKSIGLQLDGIQTRDECVHVTAQGKRMLVLHGDRFDGAASGTFWRRPRGNPYIPKVTRVLRALNNWQARIGLRDLRMSGLQDIVPVDAAYLRSFERALTGEARQKGLDGVICSHAHKPEIRDISGILYCSEGDWMEHQSLIVEDLTGALRLVTWHDIILRSDRDALSDDLAKAENGAQSGCSADYAAFVSLKGSSVFPA